MFWPLIALGAGIVLLVFSADRFVEGAAATSKQLGLPPLLIGMLVIGFGSSMPEMVISSLASMAGNPGLALGNAFGSNISNIALILGTTAIIAPIAVESAVIHRELPFLIGLTVVIALLLVDSVLGFYDGLVLIGLFCFLMIWSIHAGLKSPPDHLAEVIEAELSEPLDLRRAIIWTIIGLILLVVSSRLLVWGGVEIARLLGISDLIIGLTVVAVGTSLPELASAIAAIRKNMPDLVLGNVIGSNMFNTSVVVGIAVTISPTATEPDLVLRDLPVMGILTLVLFVMCYGFRGPGRVNRVEGALLLLAYLAYNVVLVIKAISDANPV